LSSGASEEINKARILAVAAGVTVYGLLALFLALAAPVFMAGPTGVVLTGDLTAGKETTLPPNGLAQWTGVSGGAILYHLPVADPWP